ncbi:class I SAM-dependent methyltransferase [Streptomyces sp. NPDC048420]|uniref:class I SAM-dependent DNA methyltransferase n=1 Tax=Streptomyces sp. NPDC048420 TaxID=3155755 RepID=UPI003438ACF0
MATHVDSSALPGTDQPDSFDAIKRSHALYGDVGRLDDYYRDWADSYDADVGDQGYQGPRFVADLAADAATSMDTDPSEVAVLDAGCGTGLVGVELARAGFTHVDGVDLSHSMVAKAEDTGSYRRLVGGVDLNEPVECLAPAAYDVLTCCGVFTVGHVHADALDHLAATVRRGGILALSTRLSYLRESGFAHHVEELVTQGELSLLETYDNGPYIDEEGAKYWVLRKDN